MVYAAPGIADQLSQYDAVQQRQFDALAHAHDCQAQQRWGRDVGRWRACVGGPLGAWVWHASVFHCIIVCGMVLCCHWLQ